MVEITVTRTMNFVPGKTTAASNSGWIERDNKVAIVAAFKPVLPLARSLAATLGISKDPAHGIADFVEFLFRRRGKFEPTTRWNDTNWSAA